MRRTFLLLLVALLPMVANAYHVKINGIYYNLNGNEAEVTYQAQNYNYNYSGSVVIPASVTYSGMTYTVTSIGNSAFNNCSLTSITIPNSVTSIGSTAFYKCSGLTSATIPNSVTSIGYGAFAYCASLTSVTLGNSVTNIGNNAFNGCSVLTSVTIGNSVTSIGSEAFSGCKSLASIKVEGNTTFDSRNDCNAIIETATNTLIAGCMNTIIPNSVSSIGDYAFDGCTGLTSIKIPNSVTSIGGCAFYGCSSLTSVTIPNSVTHIGESAFQECSGLTSITIPNCVTSIGNSAFAFCTSLTSITIPNSVTYLGDQTFFDCIGLTSVTISESIASISDKAFWGCTNLASITIPNSVTSIGEYAFRDCTSLTTITIGSGVTRIGDYAFSYCCSLTDVYCYADNAPSTGRNTFYYASKSSLYVPVGSIDKYKFCSPWSEFYNIQSIKVVLIYIVDGEVYKSLVVDYGATVTPEPAPTKEGYSFSGWEGLPETMPAEDITVTGFFTINSYTLAYMLDNKEYKTSTLVYGTEIIPEPAPVKKGMTFIGWDGLTTTMPAHDLTVTGIYSWSKETIGGVTYQVADTLNNYVSVVGYEGRDGEAEILPFVEIGGEVYEVYSIAEKALPKTVTIHVPVGRLLFWLWTNGYNNIKDLEGGRDLPTPEIALVAKTASSLTLSFVNRYPQFTETVKVSGTPIEKGENGYKVTLRGLEPDKLYEGLASVTLTYEDATYTNSCSFQTAPLIITTQQPKVITQGNVVVAAETNLDDGEEKVGFEWRRTDWTEDFASNYGTACLFEGTMEGYIRNLNKDKLWKYRPYYEANSGRRYFGTWVGIDPTNTSYFLPTVHTYSLITIIGNRATVMGYAMPGTDNITSQGFMYWPSSTSVSLRRRAASVPDGAIVVEASGNVMTATLENLDYETEYCCVAFVTTSEGETFFGEEQSFRTSFDPDGIKDLKGSKDLKDFRDSWFDLSGRKLPSKPTKPGLYINGGRKVLIREK